MLNTINGSHRAGDLAGQITWRDNKARLDGSSIVRSGYGTPDLQDRFHNDQGLFNLVRDTLYFPVFSFIPEHSGGAMPDFAIVSLEEGLSAGAD